MPKITIDGQEYQIAKATTILKACEELGIIIPNLCYLDGVSEEASCSICLVEVEGAKTLMRACVTEVTDGMVIRTNTERVRKGRLLNLELLLASHPQDCFVCERNQNCQLRRLAFEMGIQRVRFSKETSISLPIDQSSSAIVRDPNKCILCRRCTAVCEKIQSVRAIEAINRGKRTRISTFMDRGLGNSSCVNCGQCLLVCPTGALVENYHIQGVWKALSDNQKFVVVETAPAVRASIGEEFGLAAGSRITGKMVAALRRLGFKKVFDTQFSADLTIMEEAHELIHRIKNKGPLPLITSCSPGWIKFAEHFYPKVLKHISSCKSPQQMFGAVAKTYYAKKIGIDPRKIVVVSIMPCTAKKFEAHRPEMDAAFRYWKNVMNLDEKEHFVDVDFVLTTREAARMMKEAGIDFTRLADEEFDEPLGISTGAAVVFGATGGVMEAALRTAYEVLTNQPLSDVEFKQVRGLEGIKTAELDLNGLLLKVAVANSLSNARVLLEEVQNGKSPYTFIEIMTCPGGCLGGGGQPIPTDTQTRQKRMEAIYEEDRSKSVRKSHENPAIKQIYQEFLGKPLSELSHQLLHTHYHERNELDTPFLLNKTVKI
ncbi:MAG: NADH-dependent [FeFe] hydrogenase, group A6 [Candidatus Omnitrophica bacterium]|nr:NADH-dependent [FeFe] hydrogenase, group A6 [Candidatus Omnitrophota bacterium]